LFGLSEVENAEKAWNAPGVAAGLVDDEDDDADGDDEDGFDVDVEDDVDGDVDEVDDDGDDDNDENDSKVDGEGFGVVIFGDETDLDSDFTVVSTAVAVLTDGVLDSLTTAAAFGATSSVVFFLEALFFVDEADEGGCGIGIKVSTDGPSSTAARLELRDDDEDEEEKKSEGKDSEKSS
jgi:hypothetical protein